MHLVWDHAVGLAPLFGQKRPLLQLRQDRLDRLAASASFEQVVQIFSKRFIGTVIRTCSAVRRIIVQLLPLGVKYLRILLRKFCFYRLF